MTAVRDVGVTQEAVAVITAALHGQFRDSSQIIDDSPDVWVLAAALGGIAAALIGEVSDAGVCSVDDLLARMGQWAEQRRLAGL